MNCDNCPRCCTCIECVLSEESESPSDFYTRLLNWSLVQKEPKIIRVCNYCSVIKSCLAAQGLQYSS